MQLIEPTYLVHAEAHGLHHDNCMQLIEPTYRDIYFTLEYYPLYQI